MAQARPIPLAAPVMMTFMIYCPSSTCKHIRICQSSYNSAHYAMAVVSLEILNIFRGLPLLTSEKVAYDLNLVHAQYGRLLERNKS